MWEDACQGIDTREECLKSLEKFEENASNPNRFFAKGASLLCPPSPPSCTILILLLLPHRRQWLCCSEIAGGQAKSSFAQGT